MIQNEDNNNNLTDIISQFKEAEQLDERFIPTEKILGWIQSDDIEILGVLYDYLTENKYYKKIRPDLAVKDYHKFIIHYLKRCILENSSSDWVLTRYDAGGDFVYWFKKFWNDPLVPKIIISELKEWLEKVYKEGDKALRNCINAAILEHLFGNKKIRKFFHDWENDPLLKQAYEEAKYCAGIKGP